MRDAEKGNAKLRGREIIIRWGRKYVRKSLGGGISLQDRKTHKGSDQIRQPARKREEGTSATAAPQTRPLQNGLRARGSQFLRRGRVEEGGAGDEAHEGARGKKKDGNRRSLPNLAIIHNSRKTRMSCGFRSLGKSEWDVRLPGQASTVLSRTALLLEYGNRGGPRSRDSAD